MTTGTKHDSGKLRYDLIPALAEQELVKVLTFGANKYAPDNWRSVPDWKARYEAALRCHVAAYKLGERDDPESGHHHLAHAACCIFFLLEKELESVSTRT